MVYYVSSGAWMKSYSASDSCAGPEAGTRYGRKHKKSGHKRAYRHYCVGIQINSSGDVVGTDNQVAYNSSLEGHHPCNGLGTCLLYTSDAADDLLCVDLGCRRIIQKKRCQSEYQSMSRIAGTN